MDFKYKKHVDYLVITKIFYFIAFSFSLFQSQILSTTILFLHPTNQSFFLSLTSSLFSNPISLLKSSHYILFFLYSNPFFLSPTISLLLLLLILTSCLSSGKRIPRRLILVDFNGLLDVFLVVSAVVTATGARELFTLDHPELTSVIKPKAKGGDNVLTCVRDAEAWG